MFTCQISENSANVARKNGMENRELKRHGRDPRTREENSQGKDPCTQHANFHGRDLSTQEKKSHHEKEEEENLLKSAGRRVAALG